jgi:hypothetical protein
MLLIGGAVWLRYGDGHSNGSTATSTGGGAPSAGATPGSADDYAASSGPPKFEVEDFPRRTFFGEMIKIDNTDEAPTKVQAFVINHRIGVDGCDSQVRDLNAADKAFVKAEAEAEREVVTAEAKTLSLEPAEASKFRNQHAIDEDLAKFGPKLPIRLSQGDDLKIPYYGDCGAEFVQIDLHTDRGNVSYVMNK